MTDPHMTNDPKIMHRGRPWWPETWAPLVAFAVAYIMDWGTWVAFGAAIAAGIVAFVVRPRRRPGPPWTE